VEELPRSSVRRSRGSAGRALITCCGVRFRAAAGRVRYRGRSGHVEHAAAESQFDQERRLIRIMGSAATAVTIEHGCPCWAYVERVFCFCWDEHPVSRVQLLAFIFYGAACNKPNAISFIMGVFRYADPWRADRYVHQRGLVEINRKLPFGEASRNIRAHQLST
jgi:hypothetical protein